MTPSHPLDDGAGGSRGDRDRPRADARVSAERQAPSARCPDSPTSQTPPALPPLSPASSTPSPTTTITTLSHTHFTTRPDAPNLTMPPENSPANAPEISLEKPFLMNHDTTDTTVTNDPDATAPTVAPKPPATPTPPTPPPAMTGATPPPTPTPAGAQDAPRTAASHSAVSASTHEVSARETLNGTKQGNTVDFTRAAFAKARSARGTRGGAGAGAAGAAGGVGGGGDAAAGGTGGAVGARANVVRFRPLRSLLKKAAALAGTALLASGLGGLLGEGGHDNGSGAGDTGFGGIDAGSLDRLGSLVGMDFSPAPAASSASPAGASAAGASVASSVASGAAFGGSDTRVPIAGQRPALPAARPARAAASFFDLITGTRRAAAAAVTVPGTVNEFWFGTSNNASDWPTTPPGWIDNSTGEWWAGNDGVLHYGTVNGTLDTLDIAATSPVNIYVQKGFTGAVLSATSISLHTATLGITGGTQSALTINGSINTDRELDVTLKDIALTLTGSIGTAHAVNFAFDSAGAQLILAGNIGSAQEIKGLLSSTSFGDGEFIVNRPTSGAQVELTNSGNYTWFSGKITVENGALLASTTGALAGDITVGTDTSNDAKLQITANQNILRLTVGEIGEVIWGNSVNLLVQSPSTGTASTISGTLTANSTGSRLTLDGDDDMTLTIVSGADLSGYTGDFAVTGAGPDLGAVFTLQTNAAEVKNIYISQEGQFVIDSATTGAAGDAQSAKVIFESTAADAAALIIKGDHSIQTIEALTSGGTVGRGIIDLTAGALTLTANANGSFHGQLVGTHDLTIADGTFTLGYNASAPHTHDASINVGRSGGGAKLILEGGAQISSQIYFAHSNSNLVLNSDAAVGGLRSAPGVSGTVDLYDYDLTLTNAHGATTTAPAVFAGVINFTGIGGASDQTLFVTGGEQHLTGTAAGAWKTVVSVYGNDLGVSSSATLPDPTTDATADVTLGIVSRANLGVGAVSLYGTTGNIDGASPMAVLKNIASSGTVTFTDTLYVSGLVGFASATTPAARLTKVFDFGTIAEIGSPNGAPATLFNPFGAASATGVVVFDTFDGRLGGGAWQFTSVGTVGTGIVPGNDGYTEANLLVAGEAVNTGTVLNAAAIGAFDSAAANATGSPASPDNRLRNTTFLIGTDDPGAFGSLGESDLFTVTSAGGVVLDHDAANKVLVNNPWQAGVYQFLTATGSDGLTGDVPAGSGSVFTPGSSGSGLAYYLSPNGTRVAVGFTADLFAGTPDPNTRKALRVIVGDDSPAAGSPYYNGNALAGATDPNSLYLQEYYKNLPVFWQGDTANATGGGEWVGIALDDITTDTSSLPVHWNLSTQKKNGPETFFVHGDYAVFERNPGTDNGIVSTVNVDTSGVTVSGFLLTGSNNATATADGFVFSGGTITGRATAASDAIEFTLGGNTFTNDGVFRAYGEASIIGSAIGINGPGVKEYGTRAVFNNALDFQRYIIGKLPTNAPSRIDITFAGHVHIANGLNAAADSEANPSVIILGDATMQYTRVTITDPEAISADTFVSILFGNSATLAFTGSGTLGGSNAAYNTIYLSGDWPQAPIIEVAPSKTVTISAQILNATSASSTLGTYGTSAAPRLQGGGTLILTNTGNNNSASTFYSWRVDAGTLQVANAAQIGGIASTYLYLLGSTYVGDTAARLRVTDGGTLYQQVVVGNGGIDYGIVDGTADGATLRNLGYPVSDNNGNNATDPGYGGPGLNRATTIIENIVNVASVANISTGNGSVVSGTGSLAFDRLVLDAAASTGAAVLNIGNPQTADATTVTTTQWGGIYFKGDAATDAATLYVNTTTDVTIKGFVGDYAGDQDNASTAVRSRILRSALTGDSTLTFNKSVALDEFLSYAGKTVFAGNLALTGDAGAPAVLTADGAKTVVTVAAAAAQSVTLGSAVSGNKNADAVINVTSGATLQLGTLTSVAGASATDPVTLVLNLGSASGVGAVTGDNYSPAVPATTTTAGVLEIVNKSGVATDAYVIGDVEGGKITSAAVNLAGAGGNIRVESGVTALLAAWLTGSGHFVLNADNTAGAVGNGALAADQSGALVLTGRNFYAASGATGGVEIAGGTLYLGNENEIAADFNLSVHDDTHGSLGVATGAATFFAASSAGGATTNVGGYTYGGSDGKITFSGAGAALVFDTADHQQITGGVTLTGSAFNSGAVTLSHTGSGVLRFDTTASDISKNTAAGNASISGALTIAATAGATVFAADFTAATIEVEGNAAASTLATTGTRTGLVVLESAKLTATGGADIALTGGTLAGNGTVAATGAGAITLTGADIRPGDTALYSASTLVEPVLGRTAVGTLTFDAASGGVTFARDGAARANLYVGVDTTANSAGSYAPIAGTTHDLVALTTGTKLTIGDGAHVNANYYFDTGANPVWAPATGGTAADGSDYNGVYRVIVRGSETILADLGGSPVALATTSYATYDATTQRLFLDDDLLSVYFNDSATPYDAAANPRARFYLLLTDDGADNTTANFITGGSTPSTGKNIVLAEVSRNLVLDWTALGSVGTDFFGTDNWVPHGVNTPALTFQQGDVVHFGDGSLAPSSAQTITLASTANVGSATIFAGTYTFDTSAASGTELAGTTAATLANYDLREEDGTTTLSATQLLTWLRSNRDAAALAGTPLNISDLLAVTTTGANATTTVTFALPLDFDKLLVGTSDATAIAAKNLPTVTLSAANTFTQGVRLNGANLILGFDTTATGTSSILGGTWVANTNGEFASDKINHFSNNWTPYYRADAGKLTVGAQGLVWISGDDGDAAKQTAVSTISLGADVTAVTLQNRFVVTGDGVIFDVGTDQTLTFKGVVASGTDSTRYEVAYNNVGGAIHLDTLTGVVGSNSAADSANKQLQPVLTFTGGGTVVFESNSGTSGGAINLAGLRAVVYENYTTLPPAYPYTSAFSSQTLDMSGLENVFFLNNYHNGGRWGAGGAVYAQTYGAISLTFAKETTEFEANELEGGVKNTNTPGHFFGGAIYARSTGDAVTLTFGETTRFIGNIVSAWGNNTAAGIGGAIYAKAANDVTLSFGGNVLFKDNSVSTDGTSSALGGAIYAESTNGDVLIATSAPAPVNDVLPVFSATGNYINYGTYSFLVDPRGGAIYAASTSGDVSLFSTDWQVTLTGNSIYCTVDTRYGSASTIGGGAVYANATGGDVTLGFGPGSSISGNQITFWSYAGGAYGGAIYAKAKDKVSLTFETADGADISIASNTVTAVYGTSPVPAAGGALFLDSENGGSVELTATGAGNLTFSDNRVGYVTGAVLDGATSGGAISVGTWPSGSTDGPEITLDFSGITGATTFSGNRVSSSNNFGRGGAIFAFAGTSKISLAFAANTTFSKNFATGVNGYGGAIALNSTYTTGTGNTVVFGEETTFSQNVATTGGSAIYLGYWDGKYALSFEGNTAFTGNVITKSTSSGDDTGGTILANLDNQSGTIITLDATGATSGANNGDIVFAGNLVNNTGTARNRGGIVARGNITLVLTGDNNIFFGNADYGKSGVSTTIDGVTYTGLTVDDSIFLGSDRNDNYSSLLTKTGVGLVQFVGDNFVSGTAAVTGGTFRILNAYGSLGTGQGVSLATDAFRVSENYAPTSVAFTGSASDRVTFAGTGNLYAFQENSPYYSVGSDQPGSITFSYADIAPDSTFLASGATNVSASDYGRLTLKTNVGTTAGGTVTLSHTRLYVDVLGGDYGAGDRVTLVNGTLYLDAANFVSANFNTPSSGTTWPSQTPNYHLIVATDAAAGIQGGIEGNSTTLAAYVTTNAASLPAGTGYDPADQRFYLPSNWLDSVTIDGNPAISVNPRLRAYLLLTDETITGSGSSAANLLTRAIENDNTGYAAALAGVPGNAENLFKWVPTGGSASVGLNIVLADVAANLVIDWTNTAASATTGNWNTTGSNSVWAWHGTDAASAVKLAFQNGDVVHFGDHDDHAAESGVTLAPTGAQTITLNAGTALSANGAATGVAGLGGATGAGALASDTLTAFSVTVGALHVFSGDYTFNSSNGNTQSGAILAALTPTLANKELRANRLLTGILTVGDTTSNSTPATALATFNVPVGFTGYKFLEGSTTLFTRRIALLTPRELGAPTVTDPDANSGITIERGARVILGATAATAGTGGTNNSWALGATAAVTVELGTNTPVVTTAGPAVLQFNEGGIIGNSDTPSNTLNLGYAQILAASALTGTPGTTSNHFGVNAAVFNDALGSAAGIATNAAATGWSVLVLGSNVTGASTGTGTSQTVTRAAFSGNLFFYNDVSANALNIYSGGVTFGNAFTTPAAYLRTNAAGDVLVSAGNLLRVSGAGTGSAYAAGAGNAVTSAAPVVTFTTGSALSLGAGTTPAASAGASPAVTIVLNGGAYARFEAGPSQITSTQYFNAYLGISETGGTDTAAGTFGTADAAAARSTIYFGAAGDLGLYGGNVLNVGTLRLLADASAVTTTAAQTGVVIKDAINANSTAAWVANSSLVLGDRANTPADALVTRGTFVFADDVTLHDVSVERGAAVFSAGTELTLDALSLAGAATNNADNSLTGITFNGSAVFYAGTTAATSTTVTGLTGASPVVALTLGSASIYSGTAANDAAADARVEFHYGETATTGRVDYAFITGNGVTSTTLLEASGATILVAGDNSSSVPARSDYAAVVYNSDIEGTGKLTVGGAATGKSSAYYPTRPTYWTGTLILSAENFSASTTGQQAAGATGIDVATGVLQIGTGTTGTGSLGAKTTGTTAGTTLTTYTYAPDIELSGTETYLVFNQKNELNSTAVLVQALAGDILTGNDLNYGNIVKHNANILSLTGENVSVYKLLLDGGVTELLAETTLTLRQAGTISVTKGATLLIGEEVALTGNNLGSTADANIYLGQQWNGATAASPQFEQTSADGTSAGTLEIRRTQSTVLDYLLGATRGTDGVIGSTGSVFSATSINLYANGTGATVRVEGAGADSATDPNKASFDGTVTGTAPLTVGGLLTDSETGLPTDTYATGKLILTGTIFNSAHNTTGGGAPAWATTTPGITVASGTLQIGDNTVTGNTGRLGGSSAFPIYNRGIAIGAYSDGTDTYQSYLVFDQDSTAVTRQTLLGNINYDSGTASATGVLVKLGANTLRLTGAQIGLHDIVVENGLASFALETAPQTVTLTDGSNITIVGGGVAQLGSYTSLDAAGTGNALNIWLGQDATAAYGNPPLASANTGTATTGTLEILQIATDTDYVVGGAATRDGTFNSARITLDGAGGTIRVQQVLSAYLDAWFYGDAPLTVGGYLTPGANVASSVLANGTLVLTGRNFTDAVQSTGTAGITVATGTLRIGDESLTANQLNAAYGASLGAFSDTGTTPAGATANVATYAPDIAVADSAALIFDQRDAAAGDRFAYEQILSGNITGDGDITKYGDNVLTLSGASIAFDTLTLREGLTRLTDTAGTVKIGGDTLAGGGSYALDAANAAISLWRGARVEIANPSGITANNFVTLYLGDETAVANTSTARAALAFTGSGILGNGSYGDNLLSVGNALITVASGKSVEIVDPLTSSTRTTPTAGDLVIGEGYAAAANTVRSSTAAANGILTLSNADNSLVTVALAAGTLNLTGDLELTGTGNAFTAAASYATGAATTLPTVLAGTGEITLTVANAKAVIAGAIAPGDARTVANFGAGSGETLFGITGALNTAPYTLAGATDAVGTLTLNGDVTFDATQAYADIVANTVSDLGAANNDKVVVGNTAGGVAGVATITEGAHFFLNIHGYIGSTGADLAAASAHLLLDTDADILAVRGAAPAAKLADSSLASPDGYFTTTVGEFTFLRESIYDVVTAAALLNSNGVRPATAYLLVTDDDTLATLKSGTRNIVAAVVEPNLLLTWVDSRSKNSAYDELGVWNGTGKEWFASYPLTRHAVPFRNGDVVQFVEPGATFDTGNKLGVADINTPRQNSAAVQVNADYTVGAMSVVGGKYIFSPVGGVGSLTAALAPTLANSALVAAGYVTGLLTVGGYDTGSSASTAPVTAANATFNLPVDFAGYRVLEGATATFNAGVSVGDLADYGLVNGVNTTEAVNTNRGIAVEHGAEVIFGNSWKIGASSAVTIAIGANATLSAAGAPAGTGATTAAATLTFNTVGVANTVGDLGAVGYSTYPLNDIVVGNALFRAASTIAPTGTAGASTGNGAITFFDAVNSTAGVAAAKAAGFAPTAFNAAASALVIGDSTHTGDFIFKNDVTLGSLTLDGAKSATLAPNGTVVPLPTLTVNALTINTGALFLAGGTTYTAADSAGGSGVATIAIGSASAAAGTFRSTTETGDAAGSGVNSIAITLDSGAFEVVKSGAAITAGLGSAAGIAFTEEGGALRAETGVTLTLQGVVSDYDTDLGLLTIGGATFTNHDLAAVAAGFNGTVILTAENTFQGDLLISKDSTGGTGAGATLQIGSTGGKGSIGGATATYNGDITIQSGATLIFNQLASRLPGTVTTQTLAGDINALDTNADTNGVAEAITLTGAIVKHLDAGLVFTGSVAALSFTADGGATSFNATTLDATTSRNYAANFNAVTVSTLASAANPTVVNFAGTAAGGAWLNLLASGATQPTVSVTDAIINFGSATGGASTTTVAHNANATVTLTGATLNFFGEHGFDGLFLYDETDKASDTGSTIAINGATFAVYNTSATSSRTATSDAATTLTTLPSAMTTSGATGNGYVVVAQPISDASGATAGLVKTGDRNGILVLTGTAA
ncbi:MAG: hypothetical protein LBR07_05080, partial [Puniceicoccales bacterium]|nr:hypothetical protein [Puniceicoccales bacterium]